MNRISYYLTLLLTETKLSISSASAYRANGFLIIMNMIARFITVLVFFGIIFEKTKAIGTWTKGDIFLFYGAFLLVDSVFDFLFGNNFEKIAELIEDGDLDLMLTKPANILFTVSFQQFNILNVINVIISLLFILLGTTTIGLSLSLIKIFGFLTFFILGLLVYYSLYLLLATLSFWTIRTPFTELLNTLSGIMRFPMDVYDKNWQLFFTFLIPMIFVVTIPVKSLLGIFDQLFWIAPIVSIVTFLLAVNFWNYALRKYSSASS